MAKGKRLNARAVERIQIAVRFLRSSPVEFGLPKNWSFDPKTGFYEEALSVIKSLDESKYLHLQKLSDWVEDYQTHDSDALRK